MDAQTASEDMNFRKKGFTLLILGGRYKENKEENSSEEVRRSSTFQDMVILLVEGCPIHRVTLRVKRWPCPPSLSYGKFSS